MAVDSETPAAGEIVRREAVSRWQEARAVRERMRKNTYQAKLARSESEQVLSATRNRISQARSAMETAAKKKEGLEKRRDTLITAAETDISNGLWGTALISAATKVKELQSSIESRRAERKGRPGLLQKFGDSLNIWSLEGELQNAREVLSQTVRSASINRRSYPGDLILLFASIDQAVCQITSLRADLDRLRAEERENSSDLITATSRLARAEKKQDVSEHRYFGLGLV
jgi:chromosome segregation ATPase